MTFTLSVAKRRKIIPQNPLPTHYQEPPRRSLKSWVSSPEVLMQWGSPMLNFHYAEKGLSIMCSKMLIQVTFCVI